MGIHNGSSTIKPSNHQWDAADQYPMSREILNFNKEPLELIDPEFLSTLEIEESLKDITIEIATVIVTFINQFNTILKELIKQLSHGICTNVSNRDEIIDSGDFFMVSLNADLKYELLDWIGQYINKNENLIRYQVYQFNSPYESLLPTCSLFQM
ncbi:hypothetical protein ACTFIZ_010768 [Dictyostelium cf. discoideum]